VTEIALTAFRVCLIAGLVARVALAFFSTNSNDLAVFGTVALDGSNGRPLYGDKIFSYPPLWGFLFEAAGKLAAVFHQDIVVHVPQLDGTVTPGLTSADLTPPLVSFALKFPAMAADAALTLLLYRVGTQCYSLPAARVLALSWWINPLPLLTASIQASWDTAVPLSLFAAIVLALDKRWFGAGAILAAGVAAKLTPLYAVFLIPSLTAVAVPERRATRSVLAGLAGVVVASTIVLAPIAHWHELSDMLSAVFTRFGTFGIGGANLFAFGQLQELAQINAFLSLHRNYAIALPLICLALCVAVAVRLFLRRQRIAADYAVACFALLASLCLTSPYSQPSYEIWMIPLVSFAALEEPRWWLISGGLSFFGTLFYLAVRAPQSLFVPWCAFFVHCDVAALSMAGYKYTLTRGFGSDSLQLSIDVIAGEAIGLTMLAGIIMAFRFLARPPSAIVDRRGSPSLPASTTAGVLAGLVAVSLVAVAPFPAPALLVVTPEYGRAAIAASGYSGNIHIVLRHGPSPDVREVDAYFDGRFASLRGVTPTYAAGFSVHFIDALQRHDLDVPVRVIDAEALRGLLSSKPAGRCLLVLGGVLPATVRTPTVDLLEPWVRRGGNVFWAGGPFDMLSAQRDLPGASGLRLVDPLPWWRQLYGSGAFSIFPTHVNVYAPPVDHGEDVVTAWYASRIEFDRTTFPLNTGPLVKAGGRPLTYVDAHYNSSVSTIPYGRGTIVFFADTFNDEIHAARSIAQLLFTTAWFRPEQLSVSDGQVTDGGAPLETEILRPESSFIVFGDQFEYEPAARFRVTNSAAH